MTRSAQKLNEKLIKGNLANLHKNVVVCELLAVTEKPGAGTYRNTNDVSDINGYGLHGINGG